MRKLYFLTLTLLMVFCGYAQTSLHFWDFNSGSSATANAAWPASVAPTQTVGGASLTHNFTKTEDFTGTSVDIAGFPSVTAGASFDPVDALNNGNSFILNIPTTGYTGIKLTYATNGSGTGFTTHVIDYSTDGTTFTNITTLTGRNNGTFSLLTVDLSAITAANDNANLKIRITVSGATGSAGNNRFDNMRVTGNGAVSKTISLAPGTDASEPGTNGTFTVSLSAPAPVGGVTVSYNKSGTATLSEDYTDPQNGTLTIAEGNSTGTITLNTKDDQVYEGQETITLTLNNPSSGYQLAGSTATINLLDNETAPPPTVVINQVYGGGGNSGSTYTNDFIELYNYGNTPVSLNGWSVQYTNATGTGTWSKTDLTGSIPAHGYYLIQQAKGSGGTQALPKFDAEGTLAMSATAGKVLLSNASIALTGANPAGAAVVDKVGYGGNATGYETAPAPGTENETGVRRVTDGADTDNNALDFVVTAPLPRNSTYTTTPPAITSLTPPDNHSDAPSGMTLSIGFDKPIQKGSGSITLFEDGVSYAIIDVATGVTLTGSFTASFPVVLNPGKAYSVQMAAGTFTDAYGNAFAGISDHTTWNFTTYNEAVARTLPSSFDFQTCITSGGLLAGGFTQYSASGDQMWDCTPFGRDPNAAAGAAQYPSGIQINGYDGETNVPNVDWLISPKLDLTGTNYPLLSFWSRTAFNGQPLQLKISTDYTGGNPELATWTDLNGKFPAEGSNVWTLSNNINLSAFKGANVHLAFVYTSSSEDGARWTLDDISLINSQDPPPPSLTVATADLLFGYTASGKTSTQTFTFIGNDLKEDVTLTANGPFLLSKNGSGFTAALTYTAEEANNLEQTVTVQFAPTEQGEDFTGIITVSTSGITYAIDGKGTSINPAGTLEVVNWNVEWFGSPLQDPKNDELQQQNVTTVFNNLKADIFALVEVVNEDRLKTVVASMPGYDYVIGNYGSHTNPFASSPSPVGEAQKLAFVYNTSVIKKLSARPLLSKGLNTREDLSNPNYNDWASGRFPFLMEAEVTLSCVTQKVNFVLVHAKANTSPTNTSYDRRAAGARALHDSLQLLFPNDNLVMLGDFNDDLDVSITAGKTTTSWSSFTTDGASYTALTLPLSLAGKRSTVSHDNVIDHVVVSNEMEPYYMDQTATVRTDVTGMVSNYGNTTSDHYPVFTRYRFAEPVAPVVSVCPAAQAFCVNSNGTYTIPAFEATASCGAVTYSYTITGATTRSGNGNDASGAFALGSSTITWTATDGLDNTATCTTTVTINANPSVTISDAYALPSGTKVNTVYVGYSPASSLTLTAAASGGTSGYTYTWTNDATGASYTVSPTTATTYVVTVTDANGCTASDGQLVNVVDVRAGRNRDKVLVCHQYDKKQSTLEVEQADVANHLAHGDMLGGCETGKKPLAPQLTVGAQPNPSSGTFTLSFHGGNPVLPIQLTVSDLAGRVIETRANLRTEGIYPLGSDYGRGVYLVEVAHDGQKQTLKLIKQ